MGQEENRHLTTRSSRPGPAMQARAADLIVMSIRYQLWLRVVSMVICICITIFIYFGILERHLLLYYVVPCLLYYSNHIFVSAKEPRTFIVKKIIVFILAIGLTQTELNIDQAVKMLVDNNIYFVLLILLFAINSYELLKRQLS